VRYLLDTNIISDLVRSPQGKIAERIANVGEESVCTSIIVAAELRYGAAKKSSARLTAQLESVLGAWHGWRIRCDHRNQEIHRIQDLLGCRRPPAGQPIRYRLGSNSDLPRCLRPPALLLVAPRPQRIQRPLVSFHP
jgi:predicted nucleic acid-binding protein